MKCEEVAKRLSEDIGLSADREMAEHLSGCPECRLLVEDLRSIGRISALLGGLDQAPPGFSRRIGRRLREEARWRGVWRPLLAGSLAAAVCLGVFQQESGPKQPEALLVSQDSGQIRSLPLRRTEREVQWVLGGPDGALLERPGDEAGPERRRTTGIPARIEVRTGNLHDDAYLNYASY